MMRRAAVYLVVWALCLAAFWEVTVSSKKWYARTVDDVGHVVFGFVLAPAAAFAAFGALPLVPVITAGAAWGRELWQARYQREVPEPLTEIVRSPNRWRDVIGCVLGSLVWLAVRAASD